LTAPYFLRESFPTSFFSFFRVFQTGSLSDFFFCLFCALNPNLPPQTSEVAFSSTARPRRSSQSSHQVLSAFFFSLLRFISLWTFSPLPAQTPSLPFSPFSTLRHKAESFSHPVLLPLQLDCRRVLGFSFFFYNCPFIPLPF